MTDLQTEAAEDTAKAHLDIMKLGLHQLARRQHCLYLLCWQRSAIHRSKPAKTHQLGNAACVLLVGLDRHRFEGIAHVTCLKQVDDKATSNQTSIQPLRQRPRFQANLESVTSSPENQAINASGSLATIASRTIEPVPATTQTLDCFNETSMTQ